MDPVSLEHFNVRKTPESRTPYVLLLLGIIGAVGYGWRTLFESPLSLEILIVAAAVAAVYTVIRLVRRHM